LVADELLSLGKARLVPAASIVDALESLRGSGARLGILSDASTEVAAAWPSSQLAALIDTVVFSCEAKYIKPARWLYQRILDELDVSAHRVLYVGDGGGDELRGALAAGMAVVAVVRRGSAESIAFGETIAGPAAAMTSAASTFMTSQALSIVTDRGLTAGTGEWDDPYRLVIIFGAMFLFISGIAMWYKAR
jgi:putative hydrolase of the HAD superfamily